MTDRTSALADHLQEAYPDLHSSRLVGMAHTAALWLDSHPAEDAGELLPDQARRVAALRAAREVLETRSASGIMAAPSKTPPDRYDLVEVARFILTGQVGWDEEPTETEQTVDAAPPPRYFVSDDRVEVRVYPDRLLYLLSEDSPSAPWTELRPKE